MEKKGKSFLVAKVGFLTALIAGLVAVVAGFGTNHGLWDYRTGITLFRWAAYGGLGAAALSLIGLIASIRIVIVRGFFWALLGLVLGGTLLGIALHLKQAAEKVPPIHDITTDTLNPPKFVAILPLLRSGENSHDYGGAEIAVQQRKAYQDINSLLLTIPPDLAFERALVTARDLGWQIIDADTKAGRIEAVDTTFWFGFKDDIVIRISQQNSGSRIDIRSVSRVGKSDLGKNAERIRRFLRKVRAST